MPPNSVNIPIKCRHILDLSLADKQQFLDSFDIALSDCDGVIWQVSGPLPNTGEAINLLRKSGKPFKFISNNGMRTDKDYLEKIKKIGVNEVTKEDVITPVKVIGNYIKQNYPEETCYCIGGDNFMQCLNEMGVKVKNISRPGFIKMEDFHKAIRAPADAKIAVFELNLYQTYADYALCHQLLQKSDCKLFVTAVDTVGRYADDLVGIVPGIFIEAIAAVSDKQPIVCGKPSKLMADFMVETYEINDRRRGLFIGDNLSADVMFAISHGFQSLFVLSGAHSKSDMLELPYEEQPDYYADSLGDFVEFFREFEM